MRFPRFNAGKTHAGSPRPRRGAVTVPNMVPKYQQFPRNRQVDPGDLDRSCLFAHRQPKRDFGRLCGRFPSGFRRKFSILMALFAEPRAIKVFHFLVRRESIFLSILRPDRLDSFLTDLTDLTDRSGYPTAQDRLRGNDVD